MTKSTKVFYTIVQGEHEYLDELVVHESAMSAKKAITEIALLWTDAGSRSQFIQELLQSDFAMIPNDSRAIKKVHWQKLDDLESAWQTHGPVIEKALSRLLDGEANGKDKTAASAAVAFIKNTLDL